MPCGIGDAHFIIILGVMVGLGIVGWLAYLSKSKFKRNKNFPRKSNDWNGGYRKEGYQ